MSQEERDRFDRDLTRPPVGEKAVDGAWSRDAEMAAFGAAMGGQ